MLTLNRNTQIGSDLSHDSGWRPHCRGSTPASRCCFLPGGPKVGLPLRKAPMWLGLNTPSERRPVSAAATPARRTWAVRSRSPSTLSSSSEVSSFSRAAAGTAGRPSPILPGRGCTLIFASRYVNRSPEHSLHARHLWLLQTEALVYIPHFVSHDACIRCDHWFCQCIGRYSEKASLGL